MGDHHDAPATVVRLRLTHRIMRHAASVFHDPAPLNETMTFITSQLNHHPTLTETVDRALSRCIAAHVSRHISTLWTVLLQQLKDTTEIAAKKVLLKHFAAICGRILAPQRENAFRIFALAVVSIIGDQEIAGDRAFAQAVSQALITLGLYGGRDICVTLYEKLLSGLRMWTRIDARRHAAYLTILLVRWTRFCGTIQTHLSSVKSHNEAGRGDPLATALLVEAACLVVWEATSVTQSRCGNIAIGGSTAEGSTSAGGSNPATSDVGCVALILDHELRLALSLTSATSAPPQLATLCSAIRRFSVETKRRRPDSSHESESTPRRWSLLPNEGDIRQAALELLRNGTRRMLIVPLLQLVAALATATATAARTTAAVAGVHSFVGKEDDATIRSEALAALAALVTSAAVAASCDQPAVVVPVELPPTGTESKANLLTWALFTVALPHLATHAACNVTIKACFLFIEDVLKVIDGTRHRHRIGGAATLSLLDLFTGSQSAYGRLHSPPSSHDATPLHIAAVGEVVSGGSRSPGDIPTTVPVLQRNHRLAIQRIIAASLNGNVIPAASTCFYTLVEATLRMERSNAFVFGGWAEIDWLLQRGLSRNDIRPTTVRRIATLIAQVHTRIQIQRQRGPSATHSECAVVQHRSSPLAALTYLIEGAPYVLSHHGHTTATLPAARVVCAESTSPGSSPTIVARLFCSVYRQHIIGLMPSWPTVQVCDVLEGLLDSLEDGDACSSLVAAGYRDDDVEGRGDRSLLLRREAASAATALIEKLSPAEVGSLSAQALLGAASDGTVVSLRDVAAIVRCATRCAVVAGDVDTVATVFNAVWTLVVWVCCALEPQPTVALVDDEDDNGEEDDEAVVGAAGGAGAEFDASSPLLPRLVNGKVFLFHISGEVSISVRAAVFQGAASVDPASSHAILAVGSATTTDSDSDGQAVGGGLFGAFAAACFASLDRLIRESPPQIRPTMQLHCGMLLTAAEVICGHLPVSALRLSSTVMDVLLWGYGASTAPRSASHAAGASQPRGGAAPSSRHVGSATPPAAADGESVVGALANTSFSSASSFGAAGPLRLNGSGSDAASLVTAFDTRRLQTLYAVVAVINRALSFDLGQTGDALFGLISLIAARGFARLIDPEGALLIRLAQLTTEDIQYSPVRGVQVLDPLIRGFAVHHRAFLLEMMDDAADQAAAAGALPPRSSASGPAATREEEDVPPVVTPHSGRDRSDNVAFLRATMNYRTPAADVLRNVPAETGSRLRSRVMAAHRDIGDVFSPLMPIIERLEVQLSSSFSAERRADLVGSSLAAMLRVSHLPDAPEANLPPPTKRNLVRDLQLWLLQCSRPDLHVAMRLLWKETAPSTAVESKPTAVEPSDAVFPVAAAVALRRALLVRTVIQTPELHAGFADMLRSAHGDGVVMQGSELSVWESRILNFVLDLCNPQDHRAVVQLRSHLTPRNVLAVDAGLWNLHESVRDGYKDRAGRSGRRTRRNVQPPLPAAVRFSLWHTIAAHQVDLRMDDDDDDDGRRGDGHDRPFLRRDAAQQEEEEDGTLMGRMYHALTHDAHFVEAWRPPSLGHTAALFAAQVDNVVNFSRRNISSVPQEGHRCETDGDGRQPPIAFLLKILAASAHPTDTADRGDYEQRPSASLNDPLTPVARDDDDVAVWSCRLCELVGTLHGVSRLQGARSLVASVTAFAMATLDAPCDDQAADPARASRRRQLSGTALRLLRVLLSVAVVGTTRLHAGLSSGGQQMYGDLNIANCAHEDWAGAIVHLDRRWFARLWLLRGRLMHRYDSVVAPWADREGAAAAPPSPTAGLISVWHHAVTGSAAALSLMQSLRPPGAADATQHEEENLSAGHSNAVPHQGTLSTFLEWLGGWVHVVCAMHGSSKMQHALRLCLNAPPVAEALTRFYDMVAMTAAATLPSASTGRLADWVTESFSGVADGVTSAKDRDGVSWTGPRCRLHRPPSIGITTHDAWLFIFAVGSLEVTAAGTGSADWLMNHLPHCLSAPPAATTTAASLDTPPSCCGTLLQDVFAHTALCGSNRRSAFQSLEAALPTRARQTLAHVAAITQHYWRHRVHGAHVRPVYGASGVAVALVRAAFRCWTIAMALNPMDVAASGSTTSASMQANGSTRASAALSSTVPSRVELVTCLLHDAKRTAASATIAAAWACRDAVGSTFCGPCSFPVHYAAFTSARLLAQLVLPVSRGGSVNESAHFGELLEERAMQFGSDLGQHYAGTTVNPSQIETSCGTAFLSTAGGGRNVVGLAPGSAAHIFSTLLHVDASWCQMACWCALAVGLYAGGGAQGPQANDSWPALLLSQATSASAGDTTAAWLTVLVSRATRTLEHTAFSVIRSSLATSDAERYSGMGLRGEKRVDEAGNPSVRWFVPAPDGAPPGTPRGTVLRVPWPPTAVNAEGLVIMCATVVGAAFDKAKDGSRSLSPTGGNLLTAVGGMLARSHQYSWLGFLTLAALAFPDDNTWCWLDAVIAALLACNAADTARPRFQELFRDAGHGWKDHHAVAVSVDAWLNSVAEFVPRVGGATIAELRVTEAGGGGGKVT